MKLKFLIGFLVFCILSCKKDIKSPQLLTDLQDVPSSIPSYSSTKQADMISLAELIMQTAQNSIDFKKIVYQECWDGNETYGDYYVTVERLLTVNDTEGFWNSSKASTIRGFLTKIKSDDPGADTEPTIFVPFIEEVDIVELMLDCPVGSPEAVMAFEYDYETEECPSYLLDENDLIIATSNNVNEEYAWIYDVWVFGQEEVVSTENMQPSESTGLDDHLPGHTDRSDGDKEWGADIQVTDMGQIEPWIQGKFEFKYFVHTAFGNVLKSRGFGKRKRKNFKDDAWYNMNDFIGYWNLSNAGNWTIEKWIEEDNGDPTTVTQSYPAPCTGCPTTNVSYTISDEDDDLGESMVQFIDPIATVYSLEDFNFRRHSSN